MRRLFALAALMLGVLGVPAALADGPPGCGPAGCSSGIVVHMHETLPRGATVTACIERLCRRFPARSDLVRLAHAGLDGPGPVRVRFVARDRHRKVLFRADRSVRLKRLGSRVASCPPCWSRTLLFEDGRLVLY